MHLPADFVIFFGLPQNPDLHCECQPFSERVFLSPEFDFGWVTRMKKTNLRALLSLICIMSIMSALVKVEAAPVRFDQVVQIMDPAPGRAETSSFTRIRVVNYYDGFVVGDDGDDDKKSGGTKQDGRVITETRTDIVEDDVCECEEAVAPSNGFPQWALLGLAAIPIGLILIKRKKELPTPTVTPTVTPTPTPPEPVPEPVTILLFGTGLASIGLAARRKFGKKNKRDGE